MAQIAAGIDIGENLLTAVVVSGTGREARVTACASVSAQTDSPEGLSEGLRQLSAQIEMQPAESCAAGLPLSCLSLRNLSLPFADEKSIRQILPFELEEQLLLPTAEQIVATVATAGRDGGSNLLAAAAEKNLLRSQLVALQQVGLEPASICPTAYVLADRLCRTDHAGSVFLLVLGAHDSVQIALAKQGEVIFLRHVAWPDAVFTQALFQQEHGSIVASSSAAAVFADLAGQIRLSLDCFALQSGIEGIEPEYFVLAGLMQTCPGFLEALENGLRLSGRLCDLTRDGAASLSAAATGHWQAARHDTALALALHQAGRRSRDAGLNFRQGEFAPSRRLFGSKQQLTALAAGAALLLIACCGWLFASWRQLGQQERQLSARMEQIFQESFPGSKAGPDPLMNMRSRRKSMAASPAAMPVFSSEKRVLAILADISARIPPGMQVQVDRLVLDREAVSIRGATDAFNNVNSMQSLLSKSGRYAEVKIVSAAKGKQDEGILFEIRLQLKTEADS